MHLLSRDMVLKVAENMNNRVYNKEATEFLRKQLEREEKRFNSNYGIIFSDEELDLLPTKMRDDYLEHRGLILDLKERIAKHESNGLDDTECPNK